jgi:CubicO group peptidase (beta-lactamase class C family)
MNMRDPPEFRQEGERLRESTISARLQAAVEARVAAGAPGALARVEAGAGLTWRGSAGHLARAKSRALRPDDAFRAASVTKSVTAMVAVRLAREGRMALDEPLAAQLAQSCFTAGAPAGRFLARWRRRAIRRNGADLRTQGSRRAVGAGLADWRSRQLIGAVS